MVGLSDVGTHLGKESPLIPIASSLLILFLESVYYVHYRRDSSLLLTQTASHRPTSIDPGH